MSRLKWVVRSRKKQNITHEMKLNCACLGFGQKISIGFRARVYTHYTYMINDHCYCTHFVLAQLSWTVDLAFERTHEPNTSFHFTSHFFGYVHASMEHISKISPKEKQRKEITDLSREEKKTIECKVFRKPIDSLLSFYFGEKKKIFFRYRPNGPYVIVNASQNNKQNLKKNLWDSSGKMIRSKELWLARTMKSCTTKWCRVQKYYSRLKRWDLLFFFSLEFFTEILSNTRFDCEYRSWNRILHAHAENGIFIRYSKQKRERIEFSEIFTLSSGWVQSN